MSDDDRMDRAERIRQMREGNRDDDEPDDGEPTAPGDEQTTETDDDPSETEQTTDGPPAETTAEGDAETEAAGGDSGTETDPTEVAQRAAAAAAQITGESTDDGADVAARPSDASATTSPMQGPSGVELPDRQLLEEAMAAGETGRTEGARGAAMDEAATQTEERVRVLEFALGEEYYCIDIEYVEEIVKREAVTRVPNTPDYVEGVVDLRGQITTILEPKEMMDIPEDGSQDLIVVFDPEVFEEQGAVGWVVDGVRQVVSVAESEVNDPPVDAEYVRGVVDREDHDQFVIWVEPDDTLEAATGED